MTLTVLSVAYPYAPVGADAVGGSEQILSLLDRALVAAGHTSLVAACEGSEVAGRLFPVPLLECEALDAPERHWYTAQLRAAIERALLLYRVDLVHMHGLDFYEYELPASIPALVTLHLPIAWYGADRLKELGRRFQLCCVSESQRRSCLAELGELPVIENGVALPARSRDECRSDFALVMGRICPEKNIHAALEAGTLSGTRVLIAGRVFPYREHQVYFDEKIAPLLLAEKSGVGHEFLGSLDAARRWEVLSRAKCLLHPTLAPETSSLVAMEALACGTPVIAYRSGALLEIVEDGVTGFLVDSVEEMADAIRRVPAISAQMCRGAAEERFSSDRMSRRYLELYGALAQQDKLDRAYA
jgi:glycosyltransferase involved in cell wall biosynthesis